MPIDQHDADGDVRRVVAVADLGHVDRQQPVEGLREQDAGGDRHERQVDRDLGERHRGREQDLGDRVAGQHQAVAEAAGDRGLRW